MSPAYCRRSGRSHIPTGISTWPYNMFRLAGILQGIMGRVKERHRGQRAPRWNRVSVPGHGRAGWRRSKDLRTIRKRLPRRTQRTRRKGKERKHARVSIH